LFETRTQRVPAPPSGVLTAGDAADSHTIHTLAGSSPVPPCPADPLHFDTGGGE
jgi:hypothetical protein